MSRPKNIAPEYRYRVSGQAVVSFNGTNFYLGPHNSPQSHAKYRSLVAEYIASGFQTPSGHTSQADLPISVTDVTAEARAWIESKYANCKLHRSQFLNLCRILDDEYADTPAKGNRRHIYLLVRT